MTRMSLALLNSTHHLLLLVLLALLSLRGHPLDQSISNALLDPEASIAIQLDDAPGNLKSLRLPPPPLALPLHLRPRTLCFFARQCGVDEVDPAWQIASYVLLDHPHEELAYGIIALGLHARAKGGDVSICDLRGSWVVELRLLRVS
ncbi:hypothetical protein EJ03DRAFT_55045 [Teratosphaeria nubilosa]|uniref:Uncharacterized protein n=1 Tax=Teratosphaeria nubilosa TaxID=161662 RepID=A0A6G1LDU3_9PEZI|nr:hypothetical protein EJ03DRAFT_55045 [Teratosphaeria nubilosa]